MPSATAYAGVVLMLDVLFPDPAVEPGVAPPEDAMASLERWQRGGLRMAAVVGSDRDRARLERCGLASIFDHVQGGASGGPGGGAPDARSPLRVATSRLHLPPGDVVAIVRGAAAIEAARAAGCGLVVGVGDVRSSGGDGQGGADLLIERLAEARFPRRVPTLLDHLGALASRLEGRSVVVCLDYDGTLTPIVDDPGAAWLDPVTRAVLERVVRRYPTLVLSGRDRSDVERRVGVGGVVYAGSHGFDISGLETTMTLPEADAARPVLRRVGDELGRRLADVAGVVIERKRFSVATHYRNVDPARVDHVRRVVEDVLRESPELRPQPGKMVIDLRPDVAWDKGHALRWMLEALGLATGRELVCYVGDDETDEDAFRCLGRADLGVRVGPEVQTTQAEYRVEDTGDVRRWLEWLTSRPPSR